MEKQITSQGQVVSELMRLGTLHHHLHGYMEAGSPSAPASEKKGS